MAERSQDTDQPLHRGKSVDDIRADRDGRAIAAPGQACEAAQGLKEEILARPITRRPIGIIGGQGAIDDLRVECARRLVAEAEPFHDTGSIIFNDDIGIRDQSPSGLETFRCLEIEPKATLIAIGRAEIWADALEQAVGMAHRVAIHVLLRGLDLDDAGTERPKVLSSDWTGGEMGKRGDANARQRGCHQAISCLRWRAIIMRWI